MIVNNKMQLKFKKSKEHGCFGAKLKMVKSGVSEKVSSKNLRL